jgi:hypothetical protein
MKKWVLIFSWMLALQSFSAKDLYAHGDPIVFFRITGGGLFYIFTASWLLFSKEIPLPIKIVLSFFYLILSLLAWRMIFNSVNPHFAVYLFLYSVPTALLGCIFIIKKWRKRPPVIRSKLRR